MIKNKVHINLESLCDQSVFRYCSKCKSKVVFKDSMVKRHNANGKNIYMFAIYKCEKGHTWNKVLDKLDQSKAHLLDYETRERYHYNYQHKHMTLDTIDATEIRVESNGKQMRLDKFLHKICQSSRREINQVIEESVKVNNQPVTSKVKVKDGDVITIKKDIL